MSLHAFAAHLAEPAVPPAESWRAELVRLGRSEGKPLRTLCANHGLQVIDPIDRQLADLALIRVPSPGRDAERAQFVARMIDHAGDVDACGWWAYFPWARHVVHLLAPDDFFEVITNRNRDKVTVGEQRLLRTKTIGVVGLSVGAEAAITIAQEHLCGRMLLADFDRLDLSNLNRLSAGVDELGVAKTTIAARRIARIDPYLDVEIFPSGVTSENADEFLDELDLLVEECDGLRMKFVLRELARARGLDVIYAADERGFFSVEPYEDHATLPLFHGLVRAPHPPREAFATSLDFFRALTDWIGGWDAISARSRRSLEQVGTALCGYPQLAGEARLAAGQLAHVARRLLLGERLAPFVGRVDLEELLPVAAPGLESRGQSR